MLRLYIEQDPVDDGPKLQEMSALAHNVPGRFLFIRWGARHPK